MREYSNLRSDERVTEWDGNFRDDSALFLICSERNVEIAEYPESVGGVHPVSGSGRGVAPPFRLEYRDFLGFDLTIFTNGGIGIPAGSAGIQTPTRRAILGKSGAYHSILLSKNQNAASFSIPSYTGRTSVRAVTY
jgi:hypothetical protein